MEHSIFVDTPLKTPCFHVYYKIMWDRLFRACEWKQFSRSSILSLRWIKIPMLLLNRGKVNKIKKVYNYTIFNMYLFYAQWDRSVKRSPSDFGTEIWKFNMAIQYGKELKMCRHNPVFPIEIGVKGTFWNQSRYIGW